MTAIYLERWNVGYSNGSCAGCRYMAGVGVFHRGAGPYPPLHDHCTCARSQIVSRGMSREAFFKLVGEADRNGRRSARIEARARNLLRKRV
jgi:hypothetical protein